MIVLQSVVEQQSNVPNSAHFKAAMRQMGKLSKDIQNLSMSLRMLPIKPLVQKLQRVAQALGKEVQLELLGENLDIDKSVLDRLADPLIHILRNATDHGLEKPEVRIQAQKNPTGKICLTFLNEGNHLTVEIKDDGGGINLARIKEIAIRELQISPRRQAKIDSVQDR